MSARLIDNADEQLTEQSGSGYIPCESLHIQLNTLGFSFSMCHFRLHINTPWQLQ